MIRRLTDILKNDEKLNRLFKDFGEFAGAISLLCPEDISILCSMKKNGMIRLAEDHRLWFNCYVYMERYHTSREGYYFKAYRMYDEKKSDDMNLESAIQWLLEKRIDGAEMKN